MSNILVSVLIPTYQQEQYIEQCILSVIGQKVNFKIEVLVGDDCSKDLTAQLADNLSLKDRRIEVYRWPKNEGGLRNIDKLLDRAQGKYIAILEGDDYWLDAHHLSKSIYWLEKEMNLTFTAANYLHFTVNALKRKQKLATRKIRELRFWQLALGNFIQMGTMVYRRSLYPKIPSPYIDLPLGDYPLVFTLLSRGPGIYLPHDAMAYRVHADGIWSGISRKIQAQKTLQVIDVVQSACSLSFLEKLNLESYRAKLQFQINGGVVFSAKINSFFFLYSFLWVIRKLKLMI